MECDCHAVTVMRVNVYISDTFETEMKKVLNGQYGFVDIAKPVRSIRQTVSR